MNRLHLHLRVDDLAASRRFYSALFNAEPDVTKSDYAKWMLDDPHINLAISSRGAGAAGIDHVGVQADTAEGLSALSQRLKAAEISTHDETAAECCYAVSDKHWARDPSGVVWEIFRTMGAAGTYGDDDGRAALLAGETAQPAAAENAAGPNARSQAHSNARSKPGPMAGGCC